MIYIPTNLIDESFSYSINNNIITVYENCSSNNCTCVDIYPKLDYNFSEQYNCSSDNVIMLDQNNITDNFYYRLDFPSILFIFVVFSFFIIYCPLAIIRRFFKRYR